MRAITIALFLLSFPDLVLSQQVTSRLVTQIGTLNGVRLVAISPNNKLALTSTGLTTSKDNSICLWDVATGREIRRFSNHTDNVRDLAFSPDNRFAASASNDKTVRIWNLETGTEVQQLNHPDPVLSIVYSPDGKYLLTGTTANLISEGGFGYQWDVTTGNKLRTFPNHKKGIPAVAWSADGKLLATAGWDNVVSLFNADTGTLVTEIKEPATIIAVAFSPDTKMIAAAGGTDNMVHVVEIATGKEVQKIKCQTAPYSVMFSPDGSQLLVANKFPDKKVHLWDLKTGNEVRNFFGSTQAVISSDGRYVLTAAAARHRSGSHPLA